MSLTTELSLTDAELDSLAAFFDSLPGTNAMNIEQVDGLFCALIAGPSMVMPSEYWPVIVGGGEADAPNFETLEQAQETMALLMRHWNTIAATLRSGDAYLPIVREDESGLARGNDWAKGFLRGVEMRSPAWQSFLDDDDNSGAIVPMFALAHENDPDPKLRFDSPAPEKREELLLLMAAGIVKIYRYFQPDRAAQSHDASIQPIVRTSPKIGRNEPCPCGSGKKYKHCCASKMR